MLELYQTHERKKGRDQLILLHSLIQPYIPEENSRAIFNDSDLMANKLWNILSVKRKQNLLDERGLFRYFLLFSLSEISDMSNLKKEINYDECR